MRIATGWFTPGKDKQVFLIMAISCLSAWMMCPLMSFFATLLFKDSHNANFVAIWVQTTMLNYPGCVSVAAGSCRPAGAHGVWRRIALHQEKVKRRDTLLNLY